MEVERGLYNTRNVCTLVEIGFDTGDEELAGRGGLTLTTGERLHVNYTQSISLNLSSIIHTLLRVFSKSIHQSAVL